MPIHDPAIRQIYARTNTYGYGMGLGIILGDDVYPGFPGDLRNASAYSFPIQYEIAEGLDIKTLISDPKPELLVPVVKANLRG